MLQFINLGAINLAARTLILLNCTTFSHTFLFKNYTAFVE